MGLNTFSSINASKGGLQSSKSDSWNDFHDSSGETRSVWGWMQVYQNVSRSQIGFLFISGVNVIHLSHNAQGSTYRLAAPHIMRSDPGRESMSMWQPGVKGRHSPCSILRRVCSVVFMRTAACVCVCVCVFVCVCVSTGMLLFLSFVNRSKR